MAFPVSDPRINSNATQYCVCPWNEPSIRYHAMSRIKGQYGLSEVVISTAFIAQIRVLQVLNDDPMFNLMVASLSLFACAET